MGEHCTMHSMVVVPCGDVHIESHSAGIDTDQSQGWSVEELVTIVRGTEQAFFQFAGRIFDLRTFNELALCLHVVHLYVTLQYTILII